MRTFTEDRDTGPFFTAAARGELRVCHCADCGLLRHPPMSACPRCGASKAAWHEVRGAGSLHSWTAVRHKIQPEFEPPYTVVLVDLDDAPGARLVGRLDGTPDLQPGMAMEAHFEPGPDGVVIPNWRPASPPGQLRAAQDGEVVV